MHPVIGPVSAINLPRVPTGIEVVASLLYIINVSKTLRISIVQARVRYSLLKRLRPQEHNLPIFRKANKNSLIICDWIAPNTDSGN